MSGSSSTEAKRLVESLLGDLRSLSTEARKKHSHVKEVSVSFEIETIISSLTEAVVSHSSIIILRSRRLFYI